MNVIFLYSSNNNNLEGYKPREMSAEQEHKDKKVLRKLLMPVTFQQPQVRSTEHRIKGSVASQCKTAALHLLLQSQQGRVGDTGNAK